MYVVLTYRYNVTLILLSTAIHKLVFKQTIRVNKKENMNILQILGNQIERKICDLATET